MSAGRIRVDANVAIIMLTVHNTGTAKVEALDAGADDFVTKPSTPELLARICASLRCLPVAESSHSVRLGELTIDFAARTVARGGRTSHLTPKELELCPSRPVTGRWGPDYARNRMSMISLSRLSEFAWLIARFEYIASTGSLPNGVPNCCPDRHVDLATQRVLRARGSFIRWSNGRDAGPASARGAGTGCRLVFCWKAASCFDARS